jgi:hypothetical protein
MISGALSLRSSRCFSSFSRLTCSLSVIEEYLALEGGPPIFNPGFPSPNLIYGLTSLRLQGFHLLRRVIQTLRSSTGLSAFARRYSRNRGCFLFLCLLRCFTSARSLLTPIHSESSTLAGGLPHSEIHRSQPGYRLPVAFRRFQRPSSPLDAKTSVMRSCSVTPTGRRDLRLAAEPLPDQFPVGRIQAPTLPGSHSPPLRVFLCGRKHRLCALHSRTSNHSHSQLLHFPLSRVQLPGEGCRSRESGARYFVRIRFSKSMTGLRPSFGQVSRPVPPPVLSGRKRGGV